jgi:hypothetical protein
MAQPLRLHRAIVVPGAVVAGTPGDHPVKSGDRGAVLATIIQFADEVGIVSRQFVSTPAPKRRNAWHTVIEARVGRSLS